MGTIRTPTEEARGARDRARRRGPFQLHWAGLIAVCLWASAWSVSPGVALGAPGPAPAELLDTPYALDLLTVDAYRHAIVAGDLLVVAHYRIEYAAVPDDIVTETFLFRVLDDTGTETGHNVPYAFINSGYGEGVVSAYFTPSEAPAWESALTVVLEGNPVFFAPVPVFTTTEIDWNLI